jgi:hypothetical protein
MSGRFAGRAALITGGAKGVAVSVVRAGAEVVLFDLARTAGDLRVPSTGAAMASVDVSDRVALAEALGDEGLFDILVYNAGVDQHSLFAETTPEEWGRLVSVKRDLVFATTHLALPAVQRAGRGRIVNIATEAARLGSRGGAVYAAAKATDLAASPLFDKLESLPLLLIQVGDRETLLSDSVKLSERARRGRGDHDRSLSRHDSRLSAISPRADRSARGVGFDRRLSEDAPRSPVQSMRSVAVWPFQKAGSVLCPKQHIEPYMTRLSLARAPAASARPRDLWRRTRRCWSSKVGIA